MFNSYVLLLMVTIIYSSNLLVGKVVTASLPPLTMAFLRLFIAFIIMIPIGFHEWKRNKGLWKKEWKVLVLLSLTGLAIFNSFVYFSLQHTTSINAGIVESTTPILSIIIGYFILREKFSKLQYFGVFISLIGVIWVITRGSIETILSLSFNLGDLTMILAMVSWVFYSMFVKLYGARFPIYGGLLLMLFISVVVLFPFALIDLEKATYVNWNLTSILGLLYLGIFPSIIALLAWNKAVGDIGPSKASIFLNLIPVFTTIGAVLFLKETISWMQIIGGVLVLTGVYLSTTKRKSFVESVPSSETAKKS